MRNWDKVCVWAEVCGLIDLATLTSDKGNAAYAQSLTFGTSLKRFKQPTSKSARVTTFTAKSFICYLPFFLPFCRCSSSSRKLCRAAASAAAATATITIQQSFDNSSLPTLPFSLPAPRFVALCAFNCFTWLRAGHASIYLLSGKQNAHNISLKPKLFNAAAHLP